MTVARLRVVQIGDVAAVAPALAEALRDSVEMHFVALPQRGARHRGLVKLLLSPLRVIDAARVARQARALHPDVVHVHWVPNGIVGPMVGVPWVLHIHGSDIRDLARLRRIPYQALVRSAKAVVFATPDLADTVLRVRSDATYLPAPIPFRTASSDRDWDVIVGSRAAPSKGSEIAADLVSRLLVDDPALRIAAVDGPDFRVPAVRLPFGPKELFVERLARTRVVIGQFRVPALGISELEAMSVARPVVSNVDLSLYRDPPPILVAQDAAAAADAVRRLLDEPEEADALGLAGQQWVRSHHAPAAIRAIALDVYRRVADDGRAAAR